MCRSGRMQLSRAARQPDGHFWRTERWPRHYRDWYRRRISACAESAISRLRPCTECRARTTTVATLAAVQNGTSGVPSRCAEDSRVASPYGCLPSLRRDWRGIRQPSASRSGDIGDDSWGAWTGPKSCQRRGWGRILRARRSPGSSRRAVHGHDRAGDPTATGFAPGGSELLHLFKDGVHCRLSLHAGAAVRTTRPRST